MNACAVPAGIRFVIDIPFKPNSRYCKVYKLYSLPNYVEEMGEFVSVKMQKGNYLTL